MTPPNVSRMRNLLLCFCSPRRRKTCSGRIIPLTESLFLHTNTQPPHKHTCQPSSQTSKRSLELQPGAAVWKKHSRLIRGGGETRRSLEPACRLIWRRSDRWEERDRIISRVTAARESRTQYGRFVCDHLQCLCFSSLSLFV